MRIRIGRKRRREGGREGGKKGYVPIGILQGQNLEVARLHSLKHNRLRGLVPSSVKFSVYHHLADNAVGDAAAEGGREEGGREGGTDECL